MENHFYPNANFHNFLPRSNKLLFDPYWKTNVLILHFHIILKLEKKNISHFLLQWSWTLSQRGEISVVMQPILSRKVPRASLVIWSFAVDQLFLLTAYEIHTYLYAVLGLVVFCDKKSTTAKFYDGALIGRVSLGFYTRTRVKVTMWD
jgi:hypothetical protein